MTTSTRPACTIDDCPNPCRSGRNPLCEMHYYRARRHGSPHAIRRTTGRAKTSNGYVLTHQPGHPLARTRSTLKGWVLEHRAVLFDTIGPGLHACHWCGQLVDWAKSYPQHADALVVDHLDDDPGNNDPSNLVASCNSCNMARPGA